MLHALKIEECNTLYQNKKFKNNKLWHFNLSHIIIKEQYNLNEFKFIKKSPFYSQFPVRHSSSNVVQLTQLISTKTNTKYQTTSLKSKRWHWHCLNIDNNIILCIGVTCLQQKDIAFPVCDRDIDNPKQSIYKLRLISIGGIIVSRQEWVQSMWCPWSWGCISFLWLQWWSRMTWAICLRAWWWLLHRTTTTTLQVAWQSRPWQSESLLLLSPSSSSLGRRFNGIHRP